MLERKNEGWKSFWPEILERSVVRGLKIKKYLAICSVFFLLTPGALFCDSKAAQIKITVTLNNPPYVPSLLSPENADNVDSKKIKFKWIFSDPDPGQKQKYFTVEIDDDKNFQGVNFTSGDVKSSKCQWTPKIKIPEGTWYWRVRTGDGYTWSKFSNCRMIHVNKKELSKD